MRPPASGAIDCDIHPSVPGLEVLLPYLTDHWRDYVAQTGLHELVSVSYPLGAPITARQDWRPRRGKPASTLDQLRPDLLDRRDPKGANRNCLYGVQLPVSQAMARRL